MHNTPTGWRDVRLAEVADINPRKPQGMSPSFMVTFLAMEDVSEAARIVGGTARQYSAVSNGYTYFADGDVLVAKITPCFENGKGAHVCGLINGIGFGSTEFHVIRSGPELLGLFLYFVTTSNAFRKRGENNMQGSAGQKRVPTDFLRNYRFALPPLSEQRKIAQVLSTWDAAIALVEQLVAALQLRKSGLMQKLLAGHVQFPEFAGQEWQEIPLGQIAAINPPRVHHLSGSTLVSFLTMADVSEDAKVISCSVRPVEEVKKGFTSFVDEDVLVAKITPCFENGKGALVTGLVSGVGFGSTEFHVVRANSELVSPEFIYYHTLMHRFRGLGEATMTGSAGQKRVPAAFLASYTFKLPPLAEQRRIVKVLRTCDDELALYQRKLSAMRLQKKGLMQRLLTGEIRMVAEPD